MWLFGFICYCVNYFHVYLFPKTDHLLKHLFLFRVTSWRKKGWRDNRWIQITVFLRQLIASSGWSRSWRKKVKINIDENNHKKGRFLWHFQDDWKKGWGRFDNEAANYWRMFPSDPSCLLSVCNELLLLSLWIWDSSVPL